MKVWLHALLLSFWLIIPSGLFIHSVSAAAVEEPVRIGITPVFLDDQLASTAAWQHYLEQRLARPVVFVRRATYGEVMELLLRRQIDFAWICGYPYVRHKKDLKLLAVPVFHGQPLYQSYLIVPRNDRRSTRIEDLQGKVFAFSDPDSNSGWLVPQYELRRQGIEPNNFFRKTFFTWAHRKVVQAVGDGVAEAGAVDGYVWETLALQHPELTRRTRVIQKSPYFGFPPMVANRSVGAREFSEVQAALLTMHASVDGRKLLERLNLDRFTQGNDAFFDSIAAMMQFVNAH